LDLCIIIVVVVVGYSPFAVPVYTTGLTLKVHILAMNVGPCHHGMARPPVADGGTASNMEGSCE
jgi:hypothetical protein